MDPLVVRQACRLRPGAHGGERGGRGGAGRAK